MKAINGLAHILEDIYCNVNMLIYFGTFARVLFSYILATESSCDLALLLLIASSLQTLFEI